MSSDKPPDVTNPRSWAERLAQMPDSGAPAAGVPSLFAVSRASLPADALALAQESIRLLGKTYRLVPSVRRRMRTTLRAIEGAGDGMPCWFAAVELSDADARRFGFPALTDEDKSDRQPIDEPDDADPSHSEEI